MLHGNEVQHILKNPKSVYQSCHFVSSCVFHHVRTTGAAFSKSDLLPLFFEDKVYFPGLVIYLENDEYLKAILENVLLFIIASYCIYLHKLALCR